MVFTNQHSDRYAILQLECTEETVALQFLPLSKLREQGKEPNIEHYRQVFEDELPSYSNLDVLLENLYVKFNKNHPLGFRGHSLSVSDIVAIQEAGKVSFHYVDSFGFVELPNFASGGK